MPDHAAAEVRLAAVGRIAIITSPVGLVRVEFLADSSPRIRSHGSGAAAAMRDAAVAELRAYADGAAQLACPVDLTDLPPFQLRVLETLREVGRGQTVTYGELATRLHKPGAARAVGNACGSNPVPLWIPCHRVLASGGRLGGFSGGLQVKRALLGLEGVAFTG